jgi:hypothetical protein
MATFRWLLLGRERNIWKLRERERERERERVK